MYFTITTDGSERSLDEFDTLEEATSFAREMARENGYDCSVLEVVSSFVGEEQPSLAEMYGVRAGIDFPATL